MNDKAILRINRNFSELIRNKAVMKAISKDPAISRNALIAALSILNALGNTSAALMHPKSITAQQFIDIVERTRIFDALPHGAYVMTKTGDLLFANHSARSLFGSLGAEAPFHVSKVLDGESLKFIVERIASATAEDPREALFLTMTKSDGTKIPIETTPRIITFKDGDFIIGTVSLSILSALLTLQGAIAKTQKAEEVLDMVLEYAMNFFLVDACSIKAIDPHAKSFEVLAMKGLGPDYTRPRKVPIERTASFEAVNTGKVVKKEVLNETTSATAKYGMKSGVFVPLWAAAGFDENGQRIFHRLGTFCLYVKNKQSFESLTRKVQQMTIFADFVAIRVREAEVHEKTLMDVARWGNLTKVFQKINSHLEINKVLGALVIQTKNMFELREKGKNRKEKLPGVRSCSVYIYDEASGKLIPKAAVGRSFRKMKPIGIGEGVIGEVAKTGNPVIFADVREYISTRNIPDGQRTGSFISIPINTGQEFRGVLSIASVEEGYFDRIEALPILKVLSHGAAIAINNARKNEEDKLKGIIDDLTGLWNQRGGRFFCALALKRAKANKEPFSLIMLDLDHFKKINDEHGHPSGDLFLSSVGSLVAELSKGVGIPLRYGGEEFIIGLPGFDKATANAFAETVKKEIQNLSVKSEAGRLMKTTSSMGISAYLADFDGRNARKVSTMWNLLYKIADERAYEAKKRGRNTIVAGLYRSPQ